jgi:hypothetical protein
MGGATWTPFNDGLPNLDMQSLVLARGNPNVLYAGTPTGAFKIIDDQPGVKPAAVSVAPASGSQVFSRSAVARPSISYTEVLIANTLYRGNACSIPATGKCLQLHPELIQSESKVAG